MSKLNKNLIFVAKTRNYNIFVAQIYDSALIDNFWGFAGLIDSPTSYATLIGIQMFWMNEWMKTL